MKKKLVASLIAACIVTIPNSIYATEFHKIREMQTLTSGVLFIKDEILTGSGWQDVYVLKADLNNANIALKPVGPSALGVKETLSEIVEETGAIAAINADFFSMSSNVPSFGPMIYEGEIMQAYNNNQVLVGPNMDSGPMGTLLIDENANILMDYFYVLLEITSDGVGIGEANSYNKIGTYLSKPIILDRQYMKNTQGVVERYVGARTIVVEDNRVVHRTEPGEAVDIPENGFVLLMDEDNAWQYYQKLPIGSNIDIRKTITLNNELIAETEDIALGMGAGGILMKDGQSYTGPSNIVSPNARNPRSVVATTYNPNEILLVAVDGRGASIGATHSEMVRLLQSYGAKDALYLDGGGSTTLVARERGEVEVELQNTPSDGRERNIVNGLGLFTTSETGSVNKLYIEASNERTFVGEPVSFTVKAVDHNQNPVELVDGDVHYEVFGVEGTIENHVFYPQTEGEAVIIATVNGVQVATEVVVSKEPTGLVVQPALVNINPGEIKEVQVYGIDAEGYSLSINPEKLVWQGHDGIAAGLGQMITGTATGVTDLSVSYGQTGAEARVNVVVGDNVLRLDSFEANTASWGGDTSTVIGTVETSTDVKFEGHQSIKMTYNFLQSPNKQIAYTLLDTPIAIPNDTNRLNMWVNGQSQGDTLKVEVVDANGRTHYIKLADAINFTGWKYLSVPLLEEVVMPAKVTKIYTYAQSVPEDRTSVLYFDHISATRGSQDRESIAVRSDYTFDSMYKESFEAPVGEEQYLINVVGPTRMNSLQLSQQTIDAMGNKLLDNASRVILASGQNAPLALGERGYTYQNTYHTMAHSTTQMITLGTNQGGLRQTDGTQWAKMKKTLEETNANHIIMVMSLNPLTQFSDRREGQALHDYLVAYSEETGKDIFIVTPGGIEPEVKLEEGIRYITTPGIVGPSDNIEAGSIVQFKVVGDEIYYTFESML